MNRALRTILQNPNHRLSFLVNRETGKWRGRSHLDEHAPSVQAGHVTTRHSGAPERFALEDAFKNQHANWQGERLGVTEIREVVEIDGVPIEKQTAESYERQAADGYEGLPPGTVAAAAAVTGWAVGEALSQAPLRINIGPESPGVRINLPDPSDAEALAELEALQDAEAAAELAADRSTLNRVGETIVDAVGEVGNAVGTIGTQFAGALVAAGAGLGTLLVAGANAMAAGADYVADTMVSEDPATATPVSSEPAPPAEGDQDPPAAADPSPPASADPATPAEPEPVPVAPPNAAPPSLEDPGSTAIPHPAPAAAVTAPPPSPPTPERPDVAGPSVPGNAVDPTAWVAAFATSFLGGGAGPSSGAVVGTAAAALSPDPGSGTATSGAEAPDGSHAPTGAANNGPNDDRTTTAPQDHDPGSASGTNDGEGSSVTPGAGWSQSHGGGSPATGDFSDDDSQSSSSGTSTSGSSTSTSSTSGSSNSGSSSSGSSADCPDGDCSSAAGTVSYPSSWYQSSSD